VAALAEVVASKRDGLASVEIGKQAMERGFALEESAFPTFGVPDFAPLANSADLAAVYSVARQDHPLFHEKSRSPMMEYGSKSGGGRKHLLA
jgi:hypothetical protein